MQEYMFLIDWLIIITHANSTTGIFAHINQTKYENIVFKMPKLYPKISEVPKVSKYKKYQCLRVLSLN